MAPPTFKRPVLEREPQTPYNQYGEDRRDPSTYVPLVPSRLSNEYIPSLPSSTTISCSSSPTLPSTPLITDRNDPVLLHTSVPHQNFDLDVDLLTTALSRMSLPGLGLDDADEPQGFGSTSFALNASASAPSQTQSYELQAEHEWRFETALDRSVTVKVVAGQPELFATELVLGRSYTFTSTKAAIFSWRGCKIEVTSDYGPLSSALTSEYVAEETQNSEYFNVHLALDQMRQTATANGKEGPRTLVLGPESSGKTSLAKTITGFGIRHNRSPIVVNLDPNEGVLSLPGTMTATVFKTMIEVEEGWGNAPMSGPNGEIPVKLPLVYYYGSMTPEEKNGSIYKSQIRRLALSVAGKLAADRDVKTSGVILDTPGSLVNARAAGAGYDAINHIVSEFGINVIICMGSERLYSDMVRKFDKSLSSRSNAVTSAGQEPERIAVIKATKSGGVAERDTAYMRAIRNGQVRLYFYGNPKMGAGIALQPRQQQVDFDTLTVWRRISSTGAGLSLASGKKANGFEDDGDSFLPGDADESETTGHAGSTSTVPLPASQIFERLTSPIPALRNCVLAVMNCEPDPDTGAEQETLRDSSVMGFLYVTDVDEHRGRISLLSPVAGRVPARALVWAEGIDGVVGLV